ncbi:AEC family transporter [Klebsiella variicola]
MWNSKGNSFNRESYIYIVPGVGNQMISSVLSSLLAIVPIFGLILAGWSAGKTQILGPKAGGELNRFVIWLAMPAMLFDIVAKAKWSELWQLDFIAVFGLTGLITMALVVSISVFKNGQNLTDTVIEGLNASYPNVGFMGFPMALLILGPQSLLPTTIAAVMTICVFFAIAIILIEIGQNVGQTSGSTFTKVTKSLIRNPLLIAPMAAIPFSLFAITVPEPIKNFLNMLSAAASPCALITLGLCLAVRQKSSEPQPTISRFLIGCKLILQPMLAWFLAYKLFGLDPLVAQTAVLLAALPTGTGPFMLADYYQRGKKTSSEVVLISTLLSVFSIALVLVISR